MKVIDAVWEKRNLGIDTYEIQFDKKDTMADIAKEFDSILSSYIVVKIPSERVDLSEYVQNKGYHYIEDLIRVEHDLHEQVRIPLHQRLYDATSYREMTEDDISFLHKEIQSGMFDSDRISQDSMFGKKMAAKRYWNWTRDLLMQGAVPYVILYKEDPAGFIILQTVDGKRYQSVLGGGYQKYRKTGLGSVQKEQEIVKKLGGDNVTTHVSSNNLSQLKALIMNGYVPTEIEHVFVKHNV